MHINRKEQGMKRQLLNCATLLLAALAAASPPMASAVAQDKVDTQRPQGIESVDRSMHPSGPSTKREWRLSPSSPAHWIEIDRLRAGPLLAGNASSLIYMPSGLWMIRESTGSIKPFRKNAQGLLEQAFTHKNETWRIILLKEQLPGTGVAGIAQEDEPAVSVRMIRLNS
jgi:hypothetical protein